MTNVCSVGSYKSFHPVFILFLNQIICTVDETYSKWTHQSYIYIYNCTIHIHSGNSSIITEHSVSLKRESEVGIIAGSYFPTTPIPHTETSRIIYFHVFINNLFFQRFRVNKVSFLYSLKNVASKHNYIYFTYILQD